MTAGPITTRYEVAQCQKCQAYIFQSQVNGCLTLVDPVPITGLLEWRAALVAGKSLYVAKPGNRLGPVKPQQLKIAADANLGLYATHGCAAVGTVRASKVEAPPAGPRRAPVTPGGSPDGFRHPTAPASGSQGRTAKIATEVSSASPHFHAGSATRRPSRCIICRKLLTGNEPGATTIEYNGRIIWGFHEH